MLEPWSDLALSATEVFLLVVILFAAGLVRGFAGFALSAMVMASAANFVAPVLLIPILWVQEMGASLLMARGGWRDADRSRTALLVIGNWIGWPLGLWLTVTLSATASKLLGKISSGGVAQRYVYFNVFLRHRVCVPFGRQMCRCVYVFLTVFHCFSLCM